MRNKNGRFKQLRYLTCIFLGICLSLLLGSRHSTPDADLITGFTDLMRAVNAAADGDVLLVGDIDFSPLSPDIPYSMMNIEIGKNLTVKNGKTDGPAVFTNGAFLLSGSKMSGEMTVVRFEGILFDGQADRDALTEADFAYPWNETVGEYTAYTPMKAQQALSFKGNVHAAFTDCTFRNYMHEYGPVADFRYGDYTSNEYINLPDYSGCSVTLELTGCRIENNSALYDGGAIYIEANDNVTFRAKDCVFSGNRCTAGAFSRGGGAIFANGASLVFTDCILEQNTANHLFPDTVPDDYDTHKGGAVCFESCDVRARNTEFRENLASVGGGISMTNTSADLDSCRFIGNRAAAHASNPDKLVGPRSNMGMGGAFYIEGNSNDTVSLFNCEIRDNSAQNAYGGIYGYYVPFEDPSFGTYILDMALCTYENNRSDAVYDYTTVGDLLWMSHPGDMLANPHITLFGCYITDPTFAKDFPRNEIPCAENGYNYLSAEADASIRTFPLPTDTVQTQLGKRLNGQLNNIHIGINDIGTSDAEHPQDTAHITVWIFLFLLLPLLAGAALALYYGRRKAQPQDIPHAVPTPIPEKRIVMTRYQDADIDRFLSLVPQAGTLTGRELEVLREILYGKKQSEVAYTLGIEVSTVKDFYKKIYTKLEVTNKDSLFVLVTEILQS